MKLKSIRKIDSAKVYDLEIDKAHAFALGNGVVVHNCSEHFLGFKQMHFDEVTEGAENFYYVHPKDATFYAAADALCTYLLVPATMRYFKEAGLAGKIDQKVLYPLMHYEHEKFYLDKELLSKFHAQATEEVNRLEQSIYENLGFQINLNSPAQISQAFMRLGIDTGQRTASGNMKTGTDDLEKLPDHVKEQYPALKALVDYKSMFKLNNTYLSVLYKIACEKGFTRGAYKMFQVPTGRLAAGKDSKNIFFSPINLQALPKPHVAMYDVFDTGNRNTFSRQDLIINGFKFVMSKYDDNGNHIIPDDDTYIGWAEGMNPNLNVRACFLPLWDENSNPDEWLYLAIDYCISPDSLVETSKGEKITLKELGDRESKGITTYIKSKDNKYYKAHNFRYTGKKRKCILELSSGRKVICSPDHKFYVRHKDGKEEWTALKDIVMEDYVYEDML